MPRVYIFSVIYQPYSGKSFHASWFLLDHELSTVSGYCQGFSSVPILLQRVAQMWLPLIDSHDNKQFSFSKLGSIVINGFKVHVHTAMGS